MKILFLTNIPSPYRVDFFNEIGKYCDLTVLFERKKADNRNDKWLKDKFNNFESIYLSGFKTFDDSSLSFEVLNWLKKDYDLIIIGGYSTPTGILAIKYLNFKGIPFIINSDGGMIKEKENKLKYYFKKHLISSASAWLSTGKKTNEYLEYYGANRNMIFEYPFTSIKEKEILKNSVTNNKKLTLKRELNIEEEKIILSVGQFIKRKGFDILLRSAKNLDDKIGIYIIGGKPTQEYLNLKNKLELNNIHFLDFMNKKRLRKYYLLADLFVLPTRRDIWGLVINEAMANGLPIITTNKCVAGLELIENNKNGYIIPINNEKILSNRIKKILKDKTLMKKMNKNNLCKIRNYTIQKMAKKHIEIFNKLIKIF